MKAASIAATEVRRSARSMRDQTNKLVGLVVGAGGLLLVTLVLAAGVVVLGPEVSDHGRAALAPARGAAATAWLFVVGMSAFRTLAVIGEVDAAPAVLLSVGPRTLLGGLLLAEAARWTLQLGLPVVVLAGAVAVGLSPLAGVAVLGLATLFLATGLPVGYAVGQAVRYLVRTVPTVRRLRIPFAVAGSVAYFWLFVEFGSVAGTLARTPVGWASDAVVVAALGVGDPSLAAAGVAGLCASAGVAWLAARRLTVLNWFGDPPAPDDGSTDGGALVDRLTGGLGAVTTRPTRAVARATLLRARRAPLRLSYALVPAFAYAGYLAPSLSEGEIPAAAATLSAAYAAWAVGAAFTLNPLGDEGPLLPVTVASGVGGRAFVGGRLVAAWGAGLPVAVLAVVVAGLAVGQGPVTAALTVAYAVVLSAVAPVVAAGVGAAVPNFESRRVGFGSEAVVPSSIALLGFLLALGVVALPGGLALVLSSLSLVSVSGPALGAAGIAVSAVLGAAVGLPAYVYATRAFERYEVDR
jgi:ABC-2 type transport system permease protein